MHRRLRCGAGQGGCVSVVGTDFREVGSSKVRAFRIFCFAEMGIVDLHGVLVSPRRVLKSGFQFFSRVFPWGFENVLDYQEELRVSSESGLELEVCSDVFSACGVCFFLFSILRRMDRFVCGFSSRGI